jgi:predicted DsbA family dithiol-disulfide isomerase
MTNGAGSRAAGGTVSVPVLYDFASTLCYVAHRVLERMAAELAALAVAPAWTPIDAARLLGWRRGAPISEPRRRNPARVARELGVPVRVPERWRDVRPLLAGARLAEDAGHGAAYRARAWRALYGAAEAPEPSRDLAFALARDVGLAVDEAVLADAALRVEAATEAARRGEVAGVPAFVLGTWPMTGIQEPATLRAVLGRFAAQRRAYSSSRTS